MLEKRILIAATIFALAVAGTIAMTVRMFGIGLPTCLTDVRPFREGKVIEQGPKRYEIHYVARMWKFEPAQIDMEPGSTADVYVSTADVTHGLQIVGTNLNLMAVPGAVNFARVKFDNAGDYLVVCNEYCGIQHHNMAAHIHVGAKPPAPPPLAAAEQQPVLEKYGCTACHSIDGSPSIAPSFKALYGSKRTLANGTVVTADEAYLIESITKPDARVVTGFEAMPSIDVAPADVHAIVEMLEKLK